MINVNLLYRNQQLCLEGQIVVSQVIEHHAKVWRKGGCWSCRIPFVMCKEQRDLTDDLNRISDEVLAVTEHIEASQRREAALSADA